MTLGLFLLLFTVRHFFFTNHRFLFVRNRNKGNLSASTGRHLRCFITKLSLQLQHRKFFG